MTNSKLKKQIRDRRSKTGESYQAAHRYVAAEKARQTVHSTPQTGPAEGSVQLSPLKLQAFDALHDYAREAVVFLLDGPIGPGAPTAGAGSGTLFKTSNGRTVVLTAAHVFDGVPNHEMSLGGKLSNGVSNAIAGVWRHPSVDVAIGLLSREAAAAFGSLALSPDIVARAGDTGFERENAMLICGYPAAYREASVDHVRGVARVEFACVSYVTNVDPKLDPLRRYRVTWKEAVLTEHDPVVPAIKPGQVFDIAHPAGISGGPLWRFRKVGKQELWAPAKMGAIVGIGSTYLAGDSVEFCPSVASWGDWFRATVAAIPQESNTLTTLFSREDVRRCGAAALGSGSWVAGKTSEVEASISYDRVDTRAANGLSVVQPQYVRAIGVRLGDQPAWKFSGRIDALWGGPKPESHDLLTTRLKHSLHADRVTVRSFNGNVAEIDAIWLAKDSELDLPHSVATPDPAKPRFRVCAQCGHVKSLHVPPDQATAARHGCMHEDVANGAGGAGDFCDCPGYEETVRDSHRGYLNQVKDEDVVGDAH